MSANGDAAKDSPPRPSLTITSITFSDGTTVDTAPGDLIVLVGPNNVGKSVALKDIEAKIGARTYSGRVVTSLTTSTQGTPESLVEWLAASCSTQAVSGRRIFRAMGKAVIEQDAVSWWKRQQDGLEQLASLFTCRLTTEQRLKAADPAPRIRLGEEPPEHPIHLLEQSDAVENDFSDLFRSAFGEDLVLHRNAGSVSPLLCGARPVPTSGEDRLTYGYQKRLEMLSKLHEQGDGMRAFVGVLLHSLVWGHSVVLIDEPEAFLHPPQARMMGKLLATRVPPQRQIVMATHSGDFLRGLLEVGSDRVRVIRLGRNAGVNPVRLLDNEGVRRLWRDPILRHSNILDGLFYERVVVCESDGDCRFYAALVDAMEGGRLLHGGRQVMFTHCGGKDRIPVVAGALTALGVALGITADFDILSAEQPLRGIWEAIGADWLTIRDDWRSVQLAVNQKRPDLSAADAQREIDALLEGVGNEPVSKATAVQVGKLLRRASPWQQAKAVGARYVPNGEPTLRCSALLKALNGRRFFPNEEGELESYAKSVGSHGPRWVMEILETRDLCVDPELRAAREFVQKMLG